MSKLQHTGQCILSSSKTNSLLSSCPHNTEALALPFLSKDVMLWSQTVNLFCGFKGCGFGQFVNTLAVKVTTEQNAKTLLVSDVLLKSFINANISRVRAPINEKQFKIKDGVTISGNSSFNRLLEQLILDHNPKLLIVYPFFMPEGHCKVVVNLLKNMAKKYNFAVIINMPLKEYALDQKTLLQSSCQETFLDTLDVNLAFSTKPLLAKGKSLGDVVVFETRCLKTSKSWSNKLTLDHQKNSYVACVQA